MWAYPKDFHQLTRAGGAVLSRVVNDVSYQSCQVSNIYDVINMVKDRENPDAQLESTKVA